MMSLMVILIGLVNTFVGSLGFMLAWNWFPVEIFNLPTINFIEALGLACTIGFLTMKSSDAEPEDSERALAKTIGVLFGYGLLIVIGFVLHLFM